MADVQRTVGTTLDRLDSGRLDDAVVIFAAAFLVAAAIAYPLVSDQPALPLAVFAVPPLICATLSSAKRTAIVGALSIVVGTAFGIWDDVSTASLLVRMGVVVLITALAVVSAALRTRSQRRLSDASETAELHAAFQRGLAPASRRHTRCS